MSEFIGCTRTNYFHVKDEEAFRKLMSRAVSDTEGIEIWGGTDKDGGKVFAFGLFGSITGFRPADASDGDDPLERDGFFLELRAMVADGDAIIFTEAGHEDLDHIGAWVTVITGTGIQCVNLAAAGLELAKEMLGNPDWDTQNEY